MAAASAWVADERGLHRTGFEPSWLSVEPDDSGVRHRNRPGDRRRLHPPALTSSRSCPQRRVGLPAAGRLGRRHTIISSAWTTSGMTAATATSACSSGSRRPRASSTTARAGPNGVARRAATVRRRLDFQAPSTSGSCRWRGSCTVSRSDSSTGWRATRIFKVSRFATSRSIPRSLPNATGSFGPALVQGRLKNPDSTGPWGGSRIRDAKPQFSRRGHLPASTATRPRRPSTILHTRNSRAIAAMPLRLLAPELRVDVPFVHPDVIDAALRVPRREAGGRLLREMLARPTPPWRDCHPPTTADRREAGTTAPREPGGPPAMAQTIRANETVVALLGRSSATPSTTTTPCDRLGTRSRATAVLNWASLFAEWRATYADVLADDDAPA